MENIESELLKQKTTISYCILISTQNIHDSPANPEMSPWKRKIESCRNIADFLSYLPQENSNSALFPLLSRQFPSAFFLDHGDTALFTALSFENIRRRYWEEGITVLWAGKHSIQIFLVFREKLWGIYEQHPDISLSDLKEDIAELKMNWLPSDTEGNL